MRWVVAFNGSRDAYQVPLALAEVGRLESLVTDWYSPLDQPWFRAAADLLPAPARSLLRRRYRDGLPSSSVRSLTLGAVADRLRRAGPSAGDGRIGTFAGRLARSCDAGILSYSYYAHAAFSAHGAGSGPKVIFQVHPHPRALRTLLAREMARYPECAGSLASEEEMRQDEASFTKLSEEPLLADRCIVASSYTKRTLVENGVEAARVTVVPYGVDLQSLTPGPERAAGPLRVLFVGQMIARKGLRYLLEAWSRLGLADAELVLAGRGRIDHGLLAPFRDVVQLRVAPSPAELRALYQSSDVLCMPSLAEGFGLVYLESLACGTPVIGTHATAVNDLVTEGEQGWVVPAGDVEALMERLTWCHEHRDQLRGMRIGARRLAERHSWPAFRRRVAAALADVESGERVPPASVPPSDVPPNGIPSNLPHR